MKRILPTILCAIALTVARPANAQVDMGIASMQGTWQSGYANPASMPGHKVVVALPGLHYAVSNSNFAWRDVIRSNPQGGNTLDLNRLMSFLDARNHFRFQGDSPTLGLGLRFGNLAFQAGHQIRSYGQMVYTRELAQLLWRGNEQFIGQTIPIGPALQAAAYHEVFLGAAVSLSPNLTVGGRVKMLNGIADISTGKDQLFLNTSDDVYQLTLEADYQLRSTAEYTYTGFRDFPSNLDFGGDSFGRLFGTNPGLAFDLGARFQTGSLTLQASLLDLGAIQWKQYANTLELRGSFEYEGLDIFRELLEGKPFELNSLADTLEARYEVRQTEGAYRTALPLRSFLGAAYDLSAVWQLNATILGEFQGGIFYPALALGGRVRLGRWLDVGMLYGIRNNRFNNLGLNMALTLGPVQLLAATDHLNAFLHPESARQANARVGMNLVFGRIERENPSSKPSKTLNAKRFF